jgi:hypothetical protein
MSQVTKAWKLDETTAPIMFRPLSKKLSGENMSRVECS